ncbi:pilus assembly protein [Variovorax sp. M-6]|uniref:pilus assembly protein n=1 Tax=Variovorax sp. M-6 TaxID=3233041 RepID=UPI003F9A7F65
MQRHFSVPSWTAAHHTGLGRHLLRAAALLALGGAGIVGQAGQTQIADMPLITSKEFHAKPNLMFVLDDSGSMESAYMPDTMSDTGKYGYWSSQCNGVAYDPDPNVTYDPPVNADGTSKGNASFSAAWVDGFAQSGATTDLSLGATESVGTFTTDKDVTVGNGTKSFVFTNTGLTAGTFAAGQTITLTLSDNDNRWMTGTVTSWNASTKKLEVNVVDSQTGRNNNSGNSWVITRKVTSFYYSYTATTKQPKMGWAYTSSGPVANTFYNQCMSAIGSTPGSGVFTKVNVTSASAEAQKYANWYAYYRTRTLLMRTAVGRAFKGLTDEYRVGFSTISSSSVTDSDGFQSVGVFGGTQKETLYTKLYGAGTGGSTPLRGAVSKIGRYYAKRYSGQSDPVEYACQRNYLLLSTDGYWNTGSESTTYGPFDLSGAEVGNQDGTEDRPMHDGTITSTVYSRDLYQVGTRNGNSCKNGQYRVTKTAQTSSNNVTWSPAPPALSSGTCRDANYTIEGQAASSLAGTTVASAVTTGTVTTGGASNTLADVAEYYYKTDLRTDALDNCTSTASGTSQKVCSNVVEAAGRDTAKHQHMTTFTIGLGVSGTLAYDRNYLTQTATTGGAYADLTSGTITWPVPAETKNGGDARSIDDLWHAAVNGRGQYYSALNAAQLADAIKGVTDSIGEKLGSSSAATTSTLELVTGTNNQVYRASYTTGTWVGDLEALTLDGDSGAIDTTAPVWSAQTKLKNRNYADRRIYYRKPSTATLLAFNWSNLNADGFGSYFTHLCPAEGPAASQCASLSAAEKTAANDGARLVNFLSGDKTYQTASTATPTTTQPLYRARTALLGDIINGAPKFVSKPSFNYTDAGYTDFVQAQKDRKPMIYVAANDGMLHAFSADTSDGTGGTELWAFVPTAVMPELYRLADSNYRSKHRYFVDGAPVVGDIYVDGHWKTILVGGLGKGGRSYYALDITDPANPQALWEFNDDNLGLTFGNPVITKRANGTWVVAFSSGYNNVSPGDGVGRLFVLNANTGVRARTDIATSAGNTETPSGLDKINGWIDLESDNTSKRIYGGDLLGNLWRFDIDGLVEPKNAALQLASFVVDSTPQPITTRPRLAEAASNTPVIVVGTGRYLDTGDITDTSTQSLYVVKDSLTNASLGDVRNNNTLVKQTFDITSEANVAAKTATITTNAVNWGTNNGWWVDLPHSGERVATDIALQSGVLAIATAIPTGDACESGGGSWNYFLNANSGAALENVAGTLVDANALIVGQSFVRMADGTLRLLRQMSTGTTVIAKSPAGTNSTIIPQRTSWRELAD